MQDFGTKADNSAPPGGQLSAAEFNNLATENENAVLRSGQALSGASSTQLASSLFIHSVKSQSFQDSGAANAYVCTPVSGLSGVLLPANYAALSGSLILFFAANTSSGNSTLNIGQTTGTLLGTKKILTAGGAEIPSGTIQAGSPVYLQYDSTLDSGTGAWKLVVLSVTSLPQGYFNGYLLANDVTTPNTTISVAAGSARNSTNTTDITLAVTLRGILQTTGSWTVGDNQNKLDTGARAANTWYHVFAIRNTVTGAADILVSLSPTSPTLPSGYSTFRKIPGGAVKTDGSNNIRTFINTGNEFTWKTPIQDATAAGAANPSSVTLTLSVPSGIRTKVKTNLWIGSNGGVGLLRSTDSNAVTLAVSAASYIGGVFSNTNDTLEQIGAEASVITDTSSQVTLQLAAAAGTITYTAVTFSWVEV